MVRACIVFDIYFDYGQYLKHIDEGEIDENYGYKGALEVLNQQVKQLVAEGQLTLLYRHKRGKIRFPIKEYECGILEYSKDKNEPYWASVEIWAVFEKGRKAFDFEKLTVGKHPKWFVPVSKYVKNPF